MASQGIARLCGASHKRPAQAPPAGRALAATAVAADKPGGPRRFNTKQTAGTFQWPLEFRASNTLTGRPRQPSRPNRSRRATAIPSRTGRAGRASAAVRIKIRFRKSVEATLSRAGGGGQVSVAVLLDNFINASAQMEQAEKEVRVRARVPACLAAPFVLPHFLPDHPPPLLPLPSPRLSLSLPPYLQLPPTPRSLSHFSILPTQPRPSAIAPTRTFAKPPPPAPPNPPTPHLPRHSHAPLSCSNVSPAGSLVDGNSVKTWKRQHCLETRPGNTTWKHGLETRPGNTAWKHGLEARPGNAAWK